MVKQQRSRQARFLGVVFLFLSRHSCAWARFWRARRDGRPQFATTLLEFSAQLIEALLRTLVEAGHGKGAEKREGEGGRGGKGRM